jgi:hypothetical protein
MPVKPAVVALLLVLASAAAFAGLWGSTLRNITATATGSAAAAIKCSTHHLQHPATGNSSSSSTAQNSTKPEEAVNATAAVSAAAAAAADAEALLEDPTQRSTWDAKPPYASHYSSEADRPNMCKVAHRQPARVGSQQYEFTNGSYIPYVATSVVRDSQLLLTRLYYR